MWEFAGAHPVWFLVYMSIVCLTAMIIASSLFSTARYIFVDLLKDDDEEDEEEEEDDPDGGTRADPDEVGLEVEEQRVAAGSKVRPLH